MNTVHILGTITREIELKYSQSGSAVANFGIVYNDKWKDAQGQMKEKAHFFDVSVFGKQAETVNQYFRKGSRILVDGSLDFQSWEKDGQKHNKVGIKMKGFSFIDRKSDEQNSNQGYQQQGQTQQQYQAPQPTYQNAQGQQQSQQQYQQYQQNQQQPQPQQNAQGQQQMAMDENEIPF
ncbi:MAG: single-stranded DNA-binding protein [Sulfurimonas sp.]